MIDQTLKLLVKNRQFSALAARAKELAAEMQERGLQAHSVFGWITLNEAAWLEKQLALFGYAPLAKLAGIPVCELESGKISVHPLVAKFEEMRYARKMRDQSYGAVVEIFM